MASINLPESPTDFDFEDYISAHFHSGGYYIERNIIEKDIDIVLELDIITTNYNHTIPEIQIFEIKSGGWGFQDIFKLRGWMDYLNIPKSGLVVKKEPRNHNFIQEKAKYLNVQLVVVAKLEQSKEIISEAFGNKKILDYDISIWRFSYWVERNLLKHLKKCKKINPGKKCYKNMDNYLFEIESGVFFTQNIIEKAIQLYGSFQKYPHLSAKCGNELNGSDFDDEYDTLPLNIFKETFYSCNYNDIQISTYIEHRARLAILKSAIDYLLYKKAGKYDKIENSVISSVQLGESKFEFTSFDTLPLTFRRGLEEISTHKYFNRYPIFWQWFFGVFGGFILIDYEEVEYQLLSEKTGIPVEEIPNAFKSYQILFPVNEGWFKTLSNSNIQVMKFFPVPFMGIGANYRGFIHTKSRKLEDLEVTGNHTKRDLFKWNNLTMEVIKESCDDNCISYKSE